MFEFLHKILYVDRDGIHKKNLAGSKKKRSKFHVFFPK